MCSKALFFSCTQGLFLAIIHVWQEPPTLWLKAGCEIRSGGNDACIFHLLRTRLPSDFYELERRRLVVLHFFRRCFFHKKGDNVIMPIKARYSWRDITSSTMAFGSVRLRDRALNWETLAGGEKVVIQTGKLGACLVSAFSLAASLSSSSALNGSLLVMIVIFSLNARTTRLQSLNGRERCARKMGILVL